MGDHSVDGTVYFGQPGTRRRVGARRDVRPQASALLDMLAVLQSTLSEATRAGDQAGMREAVAGRVACWIALADLADVVHPAYALACRRLAWVEDESLPDERDDNGVPVRGAYAGRHSVARRLGGGRSETHPWAATMGRHAAERQALQQAAATRSTLARHSAGDEPAERQLTAAARRLTVADVVERALAEHRGAHEAPAATLASIPGWGEAADPAGEPEYSAEPERSAEPEQSAAERWAAEQWMPAQRQDEQWVAPGADEQPAAAVTGARQEGWHPVPRPRRSAGPLAREVANMLAG